MHLWTVTQYNGWVNSNHSKQQITPTMSKFSYQDADYAIREDIKQAHRDYWKKLATPGNWWTGAERVAIAAETRNALSCSFCGIRKAALSPNSVSGTHDSSSNLPTAAIDAVHRIITDQSRITQVFVDQLAATGISNEAYVELAGVVVNTFSVDEFSRALGLALEPLPEPETGAASGYRPAQAESGTGFVPMLPREGLTGPEENLWPNGRSANVLRALSLVPNELKNWLALSSAQYLSVPGMANLVGQDDRSINRMQMELVAGRVSSVNECFY